jgi:ABC-type antimicrobial peptide transport system permease subunit
MALGASAGALQASILMQTMSLAGIGMLAGAAASCLLFEVTASDPLTFFAMLLVLTTVTAIAGYLPARRASRIDPSVALRAN